MRFICIYMYLKLLNCFAVRYRWCYAPRYRLEVVCLHKFGATQLMYSSVTLAHCAALPYGYSKGLPLAAASYQSSLWISLRCSAIRYILRSEAFIWFVCVGWLYVLCGCPTCFLTVDFPALLRSLVNLTFGRKRCSESVVVSLLHLLLPCFSQCRLTRTRT